MGGLDYRMQANVVSPRFMDRFRHYLQQKHYSYATEETYCGWVVRFIKYHGIQGESEFTTEKLEHFLTHVAYDKPNHLTFYVRVFRFLLAF
jgi:hypothetical protein